MNKIKFQNKISKNLMIHSLLFSFFYPPIDTLKSFNTINTVQSQLVTIMLKKNRRAAVSGEHCKLKVFSLKAPKVVAFLFISLFSSLSNRFAYSGLLNISFSFVQCLYICVVSLSP